MKIVFFSMILTFLTNFFPAFAQDPDTVWTLDLEQYGGKSNCARFMPDGKSIIVACLSTLYEFETATGKKLRKFGPDINSKIDAIEISADGKTIVGRSELYEYYLWNYQSGDCIGTLNYNDIVKTEAASFAFYPNEPKLYMILRDNLILFNLLTKKTEIIIKMPEIGARNLAVSQDGKYLAMSYSYLKDDQQYRSKLYLFDAINWEIISELDDISRDVYSIKFSPRSKYVAFTSIQDEGQFLRLYNLQTGKKEIYSRGFLGFVPMATLFTNDENFVLVSGIYNDIRATKLVQIDSGKTIYNINYGSNQKMIDINSSNQIIIDQTWDLTLINSNWLTTGVSKSDANIRSGNLSLSYNAQKIILNNIDNEIIKFVNVFDINGKLVKTYESGYTGSNIELPFYANAGIYLVRAVTEDNDYNFRFAAGD